MSSAALPHDPSWNLAKGHEADLDRTKIAQEFMAALADGRICAHPAGTVFGLTFDPTNPLCWEKIYQIKKRSLGKKFLFLTESCSGAMRYWEPLPGAWQSTLERLWPAHISVIWNMASPAKIQPDDVSFMEPLAAWGTLGFRVPYYESSSWFMKVLRDFGAPLPTTSINVSDQGPLVSREEIYKFAREHEIFVPSRLFEDSVLSPMPSSIIRIIDEHRYSIKRQGCYTRSEIDLLLDHPVS